jgi:hypothetical protein
MTDMSSTTHTAIKAVCVLCQTEKEIQYSLSLVREKSGNWVSQPVCGECRRGLIVEARAAGKFVPFFKMETSEKEAAKRNSASLRFRPFLEKYGRDQEQKLESRPKAKARPKLKVAKG